MAKARELAVMQAAACVRHWFYASNKDAQACVVDILALASTPAIDRRRAIVDAACEWAKAGLMWGTDKSRRALYEAVRAYEGEGSRRVVKTCEQCGEILFRDETHACFAHSGRTPQQPTDRDAVSVLRRLMGNPSICLADKIYDVREDEGLGWDGPNVKAYGAAIKDAEALVGDWTTLTRALKSTPAGEG